MALLDPRGRGPQASAVRQAGRTPTLEGLTVGLLDNDKPNARRLLDKVGSLLREKYGVADLIVRSKPSPDRPADPALLREIVQSSDLVVTGVGD